MNLRNTILACSLSTAFAASTVLAALALTATGSAQSVSNLGEKTAKANAKAGYPTQQSPYQGTVVADIIARVNDQIISSADYDRAEQELEQQAKQRNWSQAEVDEQRKQLLRDLIDNQLLLSKGKQLGISGETETVRQLDELRKQNHLDSMEDLQKAAEAQGVSFEDFKASIRNRIITSQVIRDEVGRRINITQADEQAYYAAHKSEFDRPEAVRLSEILVPTPNPDDATQVAAAETKANGLEAQLKAGKDFAALAKTDSGGPSAAQGGALGDFKRGQLAKVLEDQTFNLKPGEYTAPIRTKQGYVILKLDAHQSGGIAPFSEVEPQLQDAVGMDKMTPALRKYLAQLREEAYIDIKPGYVDAGATPNETKPIFSAYTPPGPKKKKKLERTRFGGRGRTVKHATASTTKAASAAPPAGVPSLADVPQGDAATGGSTAATTTAATKTAAAKPSPVQTASAGTMKPGKKEKIRYGQAPRETLPAGSPAQSEDAGATAANGNGSAAEQQLASEQAPPNNGAPAGARYNDGTSADDATAPAAEEKKTRFADRAKLPKAKKEKKKKEDPFSLDQAAPEEVAAKQTQDAPLGLNGDTSKKPAKPKPTTKTRYADETKQELKAKSDAADAQQNPPAATPTPAATPAPAATPPTSQTTPPPVVPSTRPQQPQ